MAFTVTSKHEQEGKVRLGSFQSGKISIDTPAFIALTSRGVLPHVSPDLLAAHCKTRGFYFALEDFVDKDVTESAVLAFAEQSASALKDFTGFPENRLIILGPRRVSPVASPVSNTDDNISISTAQGFQPLSADEYSAAVMKLRPGIAVGLADIYSAEQISRRRKEKTVSRSLRWMQHMISESSAQRDTSSGSAALTLMAPVLPCPLHEQQPLLDALQEPSAPSSLALYSPGQAQSLPEHCATKLKLSLSDIRSPQQVLEEVEHGVDLITAPFVSEATDAGICLCFKLDIPATEEAGRQKQPLGLDMWASEHSADLKPMVQGCQCYACSRHSRAYLQHLLNAKEMLAWTLLQLHNVAVMEVFSGQIRYCIRDGTFATARQAFTDRYEAQLPSKTGQGPRVRGYQFKSEGPNEPKKNPPAFIEREKY